MMTLGRISRYKSLEITFSQHREKEAESGRKIKRTGVKETVGEIDIDRKTKRKKDREER